MVSRSHRSDASTHLYWASTGSRTTDQGQCPVCSWSPDSSAVYTPRHIPRLKSPPSHQAPHSHAPSVAAFGSWTACQISVGRDRDLGQGQWQQERHEAGQCAGGLGTASTRPQQGPWGAEDELWNWPSCGGPDYERPVWLWEGGESFPLHQKEPSNTHQSRGKTGPKLSFEITLNWKRDKGSQEGQVSDHCNGSITGRGWGGWGESALKGLTEPMRTLTTRQEGISQSCHKSIVMLRSQTEGEGRAKNID